MNGVALISIAIFYGNKQSCAVAVCFYCSYTSISHIRILIWIMFVHCYFRN